MWREIFKKKNHWGFPEKSLDFIKKEYLSNADLIDLQSNETMASIESRGYSEGCQPLAGKIYTNITKMVVTSWK